MYFVFPYRMSQKKYPKLGVYHGFLKNRPSIKATWPQHWLQEPPLKDPLKDVWAAQDPCVPPFKWSSLGKKEESTDSKIMPRAWHFCGDLAPLRAGESWSPWRRNYCKAPIRSCCPLAKGTKDQKKYWHQPEGTGRLWLLESFILTIF